MSHDVLTIRYGCERWASPGRHSDPDSPSFAYHEAVPIELNGESGNNKLGLKVNLEGINRPSDFVYNQEYKLIGKVLPANSYGPKFKFESWASTEPSTAQGMEAYLVKFGQGLGIGPAKAHRIVKKFGEKSLEICRNNPDAISIEAGISKENAVEFSGKLSQFKNYEHTMASLVDLFQHCRFSKTLINELIEDFGNGAENAVRSNPWLLLKYRGCGFKNVDSFYLRNLKGDPNDIMRQVWFVYYTCFMNERSGSTWISMSSAHHSVMKEFGDEARQDEVIDYLLDNGKIIRFNHEGIAWLAESDNAQNEYELGLLIDEKSRQKGTWPDVEELRVYADEDKKDGLSRHQEEQLSLALSGPKLAMLHGCAGSGKTHVLDKLLRWAVDNNLNVAVCAPTGKAAVRINEFLSKNKIDLNATTIHSLLEPSSFDGKEFSFKRNAEDPLESDLIIVDEDSMIPTDLLLSLLLASPNSQVLLVGDPENQLVPVGTGSPALDMTKTNIPVGVLKQVFRNSGSVLQAGLKVANGKVPEGDDVLDIDNDDYPRNFKIIEEKVHVEKRVSAIVAGIKRNNKHCPIRQTQVICATNRMRKKLNAILQDLLNKDGRRIYDSPFRVGDKVYCTKNTDYSLFGKQKDEPKPREVVYPENATAEERLSIVIEELNRQEDSGKEDKGNSRVRVANGDFGYVKIVEPNKTIVEFTNPSRTVLVPRSPGKTPNCEMDLGYACTCHKMQGSQEKVIIVVLESGHGTTGASGICDRSWLYTAITRTVDLCLMVGPSSAIKMMVKKKNVTQRKTFLVEIVNQGIDTLSGGHGDEATKDFEPEFEAFFSPVLETVSVNFKIIADLRERGGGWLFKNIPGSSGEGESGKRIDVEVEHRHLITGDYTVEFGGRDMRDSFSIERKSLDDLAGTLTSGRDRFKKEMIRLDEIVDGGGYAAIVIEAGMDDKSFLSNVSHSSIIGTWLKWRKSHRAEWIWAGSRQLSQRIVFKIMRDFVREKKRDLIIELFEQKRLEN